MNAIALVIIGYYFIHQGVRLFSNIIMGIPTENELVNLLIVQANLYVPSYDTAQNS